MLLQVCYSQFTCHFVNFISSVMICDSWRLGRHLWTNVSTYQLLVVTSSWLTIKLSIRPIVMLFLSNRTVHWIKENRPHRHRELHFSPYEWCNSILALFLHLLSLTLLCSSLLCQQLNHFILNICSNVGIFARWYLIWLIPPVHILSQ